jgi:hypothetical protein
MAVRWISTTTLVPRRVNVGVQAGLLTLGSSYWPRLPGSGELSKWRVAAVVPDYSGGPVPDFHGVPYEARREHLNAPPQSRDR